ncbi:MAG TPA: DUF998 domain-containing protein [Roseiflexaceae bacterium]|nr:DUF998 domain-containing protein [Roseiflexaceae bacterium]
MLPQTKVRLGALSWLFAIQFFLAQLIAQAAWTTPYSLATNYISDLGNTVCGPYPAESSTYVCSPWHAWMNASFILLGLSILLGAALIRRAFPPGRISALGLALVALAGAGAILVGLFPENVDISVHALGAGAQFVSGNLGMLVLGIALGAAGRPVWLAGYSIGSGLAGLLATWLFVAGQYLGLGIGGMERVAAYPLPLWMIVVGVALERGLRIRE